jgi:hypothetical protein
LLLRDSEISHLKTQGEITKIQPRKDVSHVRTQKIRKEIDQYITDVDSCIEWLQKS